MACVRLGQSSWLAMIAVSAHNADLGDTRTLEIADGTARVNGDLRVPQDATGLVIFAHGSGSSRFSRRNQQVARALEDAGWATLLMDLLTQNEEVTDAVTAEYRFDIPRLARRVVAATDWLLAHDSFRGLPIGFFGASTGAAAALIAAAERPAESAAVVSRGGRPDLAGAALPRVQAPTLLIVGSNDQMVVDLNDQAAAMMSAHVKVELVAGATHLFEEPGALEEVSRLAVDWFGTHRGSRARL